MEYLFNPNTNLSQYTYCDVRKQVISYKKDQAGYPMKWSVSAQGKKFTNLKDGYGYSVSVRFDQIDKWLDKKNPVQKANSFTSNIPATSNTYWIVGSIDGSDHYSVSTTPAKHYTEAVARAEAERLARAVPNKTFVVLQIVGKVKAQSITWS